MKKTLFMFLLILLSISVLSQDKIELITLNPDAYRENGFDISLIETHLFNDKTYLFHLNITYHDEDLRREWIKEKFLEQQKIINCSFIGKDFYYILYKLGFLNSLVKIYCNDFNSCSGFMFFDLNSQRVLILESGCMEKFGEKDYIEYLRLIETLDCTGIEYFDLNKGIYEFAGFLPAINIRQNKILVIAKIKKGLFPGIDKDYTFKRELSLTKEELEYIGIENNHFYIPFGMGKELWKTNRESLKEYEKIKQKYLKSGKVKELITSEMEYHKNISDIYTNVYSNQQSKKK